jgi:hypothetical protein
MKPLLFASLLTTLFFGVTTEASAIDIKPLIIEEVVQPRDAITREISLTNDGSSKAFVYATVNEITLGTDGAIKEFEAPVMSDRTKTVTSWIEISRGRIEIYPGDTVTVPVTFRINPFAETGEYYAFLGFVSTNKRPTAEAIALRGDADGVVVNLEVGSTLVESFSVNTVDTSRLLTDPASSQVSVTLTNEGDLPIAPMGEVIFYNARGLEVGAVDLNEQGTEIPAGENTIFRLPIDIPNDFGRYRASVQVAHDNVSIQDATEFYVLPLPVLLLLFGVLVAVSLLFTILIKRSLSEPDHSHHEGDEIPLYDNTGSKTTYDADHDITVSK